MWTKSPDTRQLNDSCADLLINFPSPTCVRGDGVHAPVGIELRFHPTMPTTFSENVDSAKTGGS